MSNEPDIAKQAADMKLYKYWMSAVERAGKKIPTEAWDEALTRFSADDKKDERNRPVVNDLRNHIEVTRAYMDQRDPAFNVNPAEPFAADETAVGMAKCERLYLQYVWAEQECQRKQSEKLDAAMLYNVGYTMPVFDTKKWMPTVRYLPSRNVRWDPDCNGSYDRVAWCAYFEDVSIEELLSDHPDLSKDDIELLKKKNQSALTEDEQRGMEEADKELYLSVRRWHIFARNAAAVRRTDPNDPPAKAQLKLSTPRRYLQFVEGLQRPLKDESKWPFDLDHHEMPITALVLNNVPESMYGFTDYQQMQRMDKMSDNVMQYIEENTYRTACKKYLGGDEQQMPPDSVINNFLNDNRTAYLPKMLDEGGKPKMVEVTVGQPAPHLRDVYELMHEQAIKASADSELAIESLADYKDVTAIGVRADMERRHQRNNLRLSGPRGYEKSIETDAIKILEIAHQFVPRYSMVAQGGESRSLAWPDAVAAIGAGGKIIQLGIDAVVGEELAAFWPEKIPPAVYRLSCKVSITAGSTRALTQDQRASELMDLYTNILYPTLYEPMQRWDLAAAFIASLGKLMRGVENLDSFLPTAEEVEQQKAAMDRAARAEQQSAMQLEQQKLEAEQAKTAMDIQGKQAELAIKQQEGQMELRNKAADVEVQRQGAVLKLQSMRAQSAMQVQSGRQKLVRQKQQQQLQAKKAKQPKPKEKARAGV